MEKLKNFIEDINKNLADKKPTSVITGTTGALTAFYTLYKLLTNIDEIKLKIFKAAASTNFLKNKIEEENQKSLTKLLKGITKVEDKQEHRLPSQGYATEEMKKRLETLSKLEKTKLKEDHSGTLYIGNKEHTELLVHAYKLFVHGNPLHTPTFPVIRKFEAEIISMTKYMLGGDKRTCGLVTSGGTESILMALKAYRDQAWAKDSRIKVPEIIVPVTAHAAFNKGAHYFGMKLVPVEVDLNTFQVDPKKVEKLITSKTVALVGSAPNYPVGTIDPIQDLAELAKKYNIGLHVDCCLGGFFLPFARKNTKNEIPAFDFSVDGVTTISADTHKYGLATKGSSVCLFKNRDLRKYTYFVAPKWMGGIYGSPSIAGSRPGALIATCWTSLVTMGEDGYTKITNDIIDTINVVKEGLKDIPEVELMGNPKAMVLGFQMTDKKRANMIYAIGDSLNEDYHWELSPIMDPAGIHFCFTSCHIGKGEEFLKALKGAVERALDPKNKGKYSSSAGIYGQVMSIPDGAPVSNFVHKFFDAVQKVDMFDNESN